jgi:hypothetical protein
MDVAGAARQTLASGSARVWECRFLDPPRERSIAHFAEGVADVASVRALLRSTIPSWNLAERFPWLDDEDNGDDEAVIVYAGTAAFLGHGDRWLPLGLKEGDPSAGSRRRDDPLWILEALTLVNEVAPRSGEPGLVRGDPCHRFRFRFDAERITGDVWLDDDQRVRRVTWRNARRRRPRSPVKPSAYWRTVELWDFGIDVDIQIPTPMAPEPGPSLREIYDGIGALWRRKRAYDRRR